MKTNEEKEILYNRVDVACGWDLSIIGEIIKLQSSDFKQSLLDLIYSDNGESAVVEIEEKASAIRWTCTHYL